MLDQTRNRSGLERDDPLIQRSAAAWIERDHQATLLGTASKRSEGRIRWQRCGCRVIPLRCRAKIQCVGAFDDGESHRPRASKLHDEAAIELQRRRD